uniref:arginyltransferase n=1 Tax=Tanacetum cinerariifolium TaxID=118510 RepID=A0A6L2N232_TANCI|nr:acyl-CoA N-acyltransferase [Tanacetum cinerariifolium]
MVILNCFDGETDETPVHMADKKNEASSGSEISESVVSDFGRRRTSCRHCKSGSDTCIYHALWAQSLTVYDCQALTDRGWSRWGCSLSKPVMGETCCPCFPIRLKASDFVPSKAQVQVSKRMQRFLDGTLNVRKPDEQIETSCDSSRLSNTDSVSLVKTDVILAGRPAVSKDSSSTNFGELYVKKQNLEIRLKRSFFDQEAYALYRRYVIKVHNHKPDHITESSYKSIFVDSPLIFVPSSGDNTVPPCGFGSFHLQYLINGKLVAVMVIDILPKYLMGKYHFWDPDLAFLSMGKYCILQGINWVKETQSYCPSLQYYSLGYYVHTIQKMRYKAEYCPSELLCPRHYQWVSFDIAKRLLDKKSYDVLSDFATIQYEAPASSNVIDDQIEQENVPFLDESNDIQIDLDESNDIRIDPHEEMSEIAFEDSGHSSGPETTSLMPAKMREDVSNIVIGLKGMHLKDKFDIHQKINQLMEGLLQVTLVGRIYSCKECKTHLALCDHIVSKEFHCNNGKAYLFTKVVNVTVEVKEERMMMTGLHTVFDIFCIKCGLNVGWTYETAHEENQKYMEGKSVLERSKLSGPDEINDMEILVFDVVFSSSDCVNVAILDVTDANPISLEAHSLGVVVVLYIGVKYVLMVLAMVLKGSPWRRKGLAKARGVTSTSRNRPRLGLKGQNGAVCPGELLWKECGAVGCQENREKKRKNGAICLGGKHCALYSVLKTGTTGMVEFAILALQLAGRRLSQTSSKSLPRRHHHHHLSSPNTMVVPLMLQYESQAAARDGGSIDELLGLSKDIGLQVTINPEVTSKIKCKHIMQCLIEQYKASHLVNRGLAYVGKKSAFAAGPLPFENKEFVIVVPQNDGRQREFKVAVKFAATKNIDHLHQFLSGRQHDNPQETIQALDIVLREAASSNDTAFEMGLLGNGVDYCRGFYQIMRPTQMGLSLILDMSATVFYRTFC